MRLGAVVALLAAAIAVAVVVLGGQGTDDGGGTATATAGHSGRKRGPAPVRHATGNEVRNATPQADWVPYDGEVPIFRYQVVGEPGPGEPYIERFVEPGDFEEQMDYLEAQGYQAVTLATVERAWFHGGTLPEKPAVISFDAVGGDLLSTVLPDLTGRGWPGVVVLDPEAPIKGRAAVGKLIEAGWEVAAEAAEPASARRALQREFGVTVEDYSYPSGKADEGSRAAVEAAGYAGATVSTPGFASPDSPFELARVQVFGLSRLDGFEEMIQSRGRGAGA
jgi:peptidoglycan/xylan/chitin deacetylase (PgdA/CDA1 family)